MVIRFHFQLQNLEFNKGVFTLKTHQIFPVHPRRRNSKRNHHRHFGFAIVFEKKNNNGHVNHVIIIMSWFLKGSIFKILLSTRKRKSIRRFKIPPV